eukprot:CAMPEP_0117535962 /NCGR_PEP_ID=MMETSP0784-20121206/41204_1 /TAXON_ID=39447 /ORGANISM="" /LENGTH=263 /DNA_ID=CAMNT_0005332503 /DNA_START=42 /DNA_END=830 /DNA_ORIENTATION=+
MANDYYAVLGVACNATAKEIGKAFRAKARVLHPDKQPTGASAAAKQRATKAFQELAKAYEVLSDAARRAEYDVSRGEPANAAQPTYEPPPPPNRTAGCGRDARDHDGGLGARAEAARAQQKEEEKERQKQRRKKEEEWEERENFRNGLGAHWVKPPKWEEVKWDGWVKSGAGGPPEDDASDVSSKLSFHLGININDLNLDDLEPLTPENELEQRLQYGEMWRPFPAANKEAEEEPKPMHDNGTGGDSCEENAAHAKSAPAPPR